MMLMRERLYDAATTCRSMISSVFGGAASLRSTHATFLTASRCPRSCPTGFIICLVSQIPTIESLPAVAMTGSYLFQSQCSTSPSLRCQRFSGRTYIPCSDRGCRFELLRSQVEYMQEAILTTCSQDFRLTGRPARCIRLALMSGNGTCRRLSLQLPLSTLSALN